MKERLLKLRAVLLLAILSVVGLSAYAGDDFYAKVTATATPTGAGKVYVYPDYKNGPDIRNVADSDFKDSDEFVFNFQSGQETAPCEENTIFLYAKAAQGCTFEGWALATAPNEIISTEAKFSPTFEVSSKDEENPDIFNYIAKFSGKAPAPFISGATMICGEDEITLSTESEVSVESASAIMVRLAENIKYATYTVNEVVDAEDNGTHMDTTKPLITKATQFHSPMTTDDEQTDGDIDAVYPFLIDGYLDTYWHSRWEDGSQPMGTHYLQVSDIDEESIVLVMSRRYWQSDQVTSMSVWGYDSADDAIAKEEGVKLAEIELPFGASGETLTSAPFLTQGKSVLRFYAESTDGTGTSYNRGYWHCSEFQLYPATDGDGNQTQKTPIATGVLSINTVGYAEFQKELMFKLGTKYNIEIKAWDVDEDHLITPELTIKDPVATFTCDFIGAYEEKNELDFTDKVVKEVKANTSNIEEGKWYTWSNPRKANSQYAAPTPFYDQGEGKKPVREAAGQTVRTVLSQNTPVSDVTKYLVRFVKSATGEAYHIQFATGNYLKKDLTTSATAEEAGLFMVYAATNSKADAAGEPYTEAGVGINITDDGVAYGMRLDGNGAGAELVTWGNSKIETPDANNVWFFEEVEMAEPTTETYTVHITGAPNETKVTFGEQQYGDGETFDATGFSLSQLTVPDHEDYVKSVEIDGTDIYVTYTYAKKVADLSEINNEHAYVLICERGQLTTNEGELAPTAEKSYSESKSVFAFVKYNDNYYMWSTAEEGFVFNDKSIATEGEFQNVVFNPQEDGTFVLYIADNEHYINIDGTTTLFIDAWDTADAGNKYSIYEVETFDATDALNILEDFTTGINAVATPAAPAAIYSLTGQRQQRLQKGINIVRRQKVIK